MRKSLACMLFLALAASVMSAADPAAALKSADAGWSKATESRNLDQFMSFVRDDISMCGPDGKWIQGKAVVREGWSKMLADPSFKLSWTAESAEVSKDGKMGYTRGTFSGNMGGKPMGGSYATVWKKDSDGKWRVLVDIASGAAQQ